jgi:hypothetical protein
MLDNDIQLEYIKSWDVERELDLVINEFVPFNWIGLVREGVK